MCAAIELVPLQRAGWGEIRWDVIWWVRRGLKRRGYSYLPCAIDFLRTAGEKLENGLLVLDCRAGPGPSSWEAWHGSTTLSTTLSSEPESVENRGRGTPAGGRPVQRDRPARALHRR